MKYRLSFRILIATCSFLGIIIGIINNNFYHDSLIEQLKNESIINETKNENNKEKENNKENDNKYNNFTNEKEENQEEEENIEYDENRSKKNIGNKLRIPVSYALDNRYLYPTLVAMVSLVENAGSNTFYDIYVLLSPDFKNENKIVLKSVEKNHYEICSVIFIGMGNKYKKEKTDKRIPTPTYYRLDLQNLLPEVDRIIYMDGDTMVFEDLSPLMSLDMKGNYYLGFLDSVPDAIKSFGIKDAIVINAGVLLIDLNALRINNITEKFNIFMEENRDNIPQHDQTIINVVCQDHISTLPIKYGIWGFESKFYLLEHNKKQRPFLKYNEKELIEAYQHPAIIHWVWPKPFWRNRRTVFYDKWWGYAKISGYYNDIYNKSPKPSRLLMEIMKRYIY
jgi:lipopolysaccharide biosynthesis glycosyltransferase